MKKAVFTLAIGDNPMYRAAVMSFQRYADRVDADLIVVGARGLSALRRFVRGSVSTRVAHHSTRDVLIVEHDD